MKYGRSDRQSRKRSWEPDDPAVDCAWEEGDDDTWYCGEPVQSELQVLSEPLPLYPRPTRLRADVSGQSDMGTLFTHVAGDDPYDVLPLLDAAGVDGPSTSSQLMRVSGGFDVADYTPPESCVGLTGDEALLCPLARLREDVEARGMSMRSYGAVFQGQAVTYDDAHKSHLPNTGYADCEYQPVVEDDTCQPYLCPAWFGVPDEVGVDNAAYEDDLDRLAHAGELGVRDVFFDHEPSAGYRYCERLGEDWTTGEHGDVDGDHIEDCPAPDDISEDGRVDACDVRLQEYLADKALTLWSDAHEAVEGGLAAR